MISDSFMRSAWAGLLLAIASLASDAVGQPVAGADAFAERATLSGSGTAVGDLRVGTPEAGDPVLPGIPQGQTLWWRYQAPVKGRVKIEAVATGFTPLVAVYRASELALSPPVASNAARFCSSCFGCETRLRPGLAFDVRPGEEFAVVADVHGFVPTGVAVPTPDLQPEPAGGPFELRFSFVPTPDNDDADAAQALSGMAAQARALLWAASGEPGEAAHGGNPGGRSVWFTWTAPETGQLEVSPGRPRVFPEPAAVPGPLPWATRSELASTWPLLREDWSLPAGYGSVFTIDNSGGGVIDFCAFQEQNAPPPFFPVFAVYSLLAGGWTPLAGGTNVTCFLAAGTTVRLAVAGNSGTGEDVDFQLRLTPRPVNTEFSGRMVLPSHSAEAVGHTLGTGWPFGGVPSPGYQGQPRSWWTWMAPKEGPVWLGTSFSDRRTWIEVFTGDQPAGLENVTSGDTSVSFYARQGVAYQISLAVTDAPGEFRFSLRHLPARLRPALVTGSTDHPGILLSEVGADRILVQLEGQGRWYDAALAVAAPGLPSAASAYLVPLERLPGAEASIGARVWLLDFPVPAVEVAALRPLADPAGAVSLEILGVPGQAVVMESSADLHEWSPLPGSTLKVFATQVVFVGAVGQPQRFYRAREAAPEVKPLRLPGF